MNDPKNDDNKITPLQELLEFKVVLFIVCFAIAFTVGWFVFPWPFR